MSKKISNYIKLQIPAGKANPSPPVGPALGQHGVNIMEFCKTFNAQTANLESGILVPVVITVYADKSFSFIQKSPPASTLIKKAINLKSGSATPNTVKVGKITRSQLSDIASIKAKDLNSGSEDGAIAILAGTARSMGIEVID